ncbi:flavin reductase [Labrys sp. LIt4]|uniref:Flavin reductase like domain-containing protein n=1 Tax=Labrys okinawensis TaxID=346911 RepID=A0A2S9Q8W5_9HYPH|nr:MULTISPECIES: LysR substrate-binding domain-containing protein [Labrys]MBP0580666.1 flavin reductase [Labrys sp. LIt4]PRH85795.1 hypothetical protein C5L14_19780 [Labrys okinawensis]
MGAGIDPKVREKFLGGMSQAACTVNVVSTDGPAGRAGVTVSAMASVSADTELPTMLVCVHHLSPAAAKIVENGVLCVNVLRDDQSYISDVFAGRFRDEIGDKFECTEWVTASTGAPRIADPLVAFDCRLLSSEKVGTHHIFLCEVRDIHLSRHGSPLIYANRSYGSSNRIEGASSLRAALAGETARLVIGCFHTFGPYLMPSLIREMGGIGVKLIEGDHRRLRESLLAGESELALLYDFDLGEEFEKLSLGELTPYVLLAADHPLCHQSEVAPEDLAAEPMILLDAPPSRDYFTGILEDAGIKPLIAYRSISFEMVRGMVAHGLGYSILATKPASDMSYDGLNLATRPLTGRHRENRIVLAHRAGRELSPAARHFADLCAKRFARR